MKKLLTRKPATTSTSTKQESHTQEIKPENKNYPATTSTISSSRKLEILH